MILIQAIFIYLLYCKFSGSLIAVLSAFSLGAPLSVFDRAVRAQLLKCKYDGIAPLFKNLSLILANVPTLYKGL